jgi:hypothetical protein
MAKGVKKTVLEKQINIYNQFQYQNRQSDRLGLTRNVPVTAAEQIARNIENAKIENARLTREKQIAEFKKSEPLFGSLKDLSSDEVREISRIKSEWVEKFHKFMKTLK